MGIIAILKINFEKVVLSCKTYKLKNSYKIQDNILNEKKKEKPPTLSPKLFFFPFVCR